MKWLNKCNFFSFHHKKILEFSRELSPSSTFMESRTLKVKLTIIKKNKEIHTLNKKKYIFFLCTIEIRTQISIKDLFNALLCCLWCQRKLKS